MKCRWCRGRGWEAAEPGSSLRWACPDCEGTGIELEDEEDEETEEDEENENDEN
jgi:hypothetical protein